MENLIITWEYMQHQTYNMLTEELNMIGSEGWELIAVTPAFSERSQIHNGAVMLPSGHIYLFKRQRVYTKEELEEISRNIQQRYDWRHPVS